MNASKQRRRRGVDTVLMWVQRSPSSIPPFIEATSALIDATLIEGNEHQLRLAYSMAVVRAVNLIVDTIQDDTVRARTSVLSLAKKLDLPLWLVKIRHSATHEALPSIQVLRLASEQLINYLVKVYWIPQETLVRDRETILFVTIPERVRNILVAFHGSLENEKFKSADKSEVYKIFAERFINDLKPLLPNGFLRAEIGFNYLLDSIIYHLAMVISTFGKYEQEYLDLLDEIGKTFATHQTLINRWVYYHIAESNSFNKNHASIVPWLSSMVERYIRKNSKMKDKSLAKGSASYRQIKEWIIICAGNSNDISILTIEVLQQSTQKVDDVLGDVTLFKGTIKDSKKSEEAMDIEESPNNGKSIESLEEECRAYEIKVFGENYRDPQSLNSSSPWCTTRNCKHTLIQ